MAYCHTNAAEAVKSISRANENFSQSLYQQFANLTVLPNFVYSPMNLSAIFALVKTGAKNASELELRNVFHLSRNAVDIYNGYEMLLKSLQNDFDALIWKSANKIYFPTGFPIKNEFKRIASEIFLTEIEQIHFVDNIRSAKKINDWLTIRTDNQITNVVPPVILNGSTRMVLINGIYFKGLWKNSFQRARTRRFPFRLTLNTSKDVDMMHMEKMQCPYVHLENIKIVAIPYKGDRLHMMIYLPEEGSTLNTMESTLQTLNLSAIIGAMDSQYVNLSLPKFKCESSFQLKSTLQNLGLKTIFTDAANFSNIVEQTSLYVSDVIHKVVVEVSEEGALAAPSRAFRPYDLGKPYLPPLPVIEFNVNRPFMFQIVDIQSNFIIFAGKVKNP